MELVETLIFSAVKIVTAVYLTEAKAAVQNPEQKLLHLETCSGVACFSFPFQLLGVLMGNKLCGISDWNHFF